MAPFPRTATCAALAAALALAAAGVTAQLRIPGQTAAPATRDTAEPLSESARVVLERARPSLVTIRGFFGANTAHQFHGTGFAVAPGGLVLTNFHVVAEQVLYPDKYRLEYRTADGATGPVEVLAVDVRHDLAVVRARDFDPPPLELDPDVPAKGVRAYAIGYPLDVGLTITEGVSNGRVEDSFDPRIHYSGALNGGMSGGPALLADGRVIGINVAGYRFEQLVSFLVPAVHARALIERAQNAPLAAGTARKDILAQMKAHSAALLGALEAAAPAPTQRVAGYALPGKLAPFVDCNAAGDPAPEQPIRMERINCSAKAGLYIQQGLFSGDLRYQHYVLTTTRLDPWRFANRLSGLSSARGGFGSRRHVGRYACRDEAVALAGFDAKLLVCTRGLRNFEGLYDITVRVVSLNHPARGFASHLDVYGVEFDAGMRFVRRYVEAIRAEARGESS